MPVAQEMPQVDATWNGIAVTLIDPAGLRATDDPVEQRGIALGESRVAAADVVVLVNDGQAPWDERALQRTPRAGAQQGRPRRGRAASAAHLCGHGSGARGSASPRAPPLILVRGDRPLRRDFVTCAFGITS
jgi:hypothetical protein